MSSGYSADVRTFHAGGVAGDDITQGSAATSTSCLRLARQVKAVISEIAGDVKIWEDGDKYIVQVTPSRAKWSRSNSTVKLFDASSGTDVIALAMCWQANEDESPCGCAVWRCRHGGEGERSVVVTGGSQHPFFTDSSPTSTRNSRRRYGGSGDRVAMVRSAYTSECASKFIENTNATSMMKKSCVSTLPGQTLPTTFRVIVHMFNRVQIEEPGDSLFVTGDILAELPVDEKQTAWRRRADTGTVTQLLLRYRRSLYLGDIGSWVLHRSRHNPRADQCTTCLHLPPACLPAGCVDHL